MKIIFLFLDKEEEENCSQKKEEKTIFPKPNTPPEETSDVKAVSDCTPKKSVGTCKKCLTGDQCIDGFCCPFMKVCVKSSSTACGQPIAQCIPVCRDSMDQKECKCMNKDFPEKWAKPTCEGN